MPVRAVERSRDYCFRQAVHEAGDFVFCVLPIGGHAFVGDAAEEQAVGGFQLFDGKAFEFVAPDRLMKAEVSAFAAFEEAIEGH